jgi:hypothetical protein
MFRHKILFVFVSLALMMIALNTTQAQTTMERSGWGARRGLVGQTITKPSETQLEAEQQISQQETWEHALATNDSVFERAREARRNALVGTWRIHIPQSNAGLPPFNALHTFHSDGTFTETSDLLGFLNEGPAHGVWNGDGPHFLLTFELFVFNPDHTPAGMVRVRCAIVAVPGSNQFTAQYKVDFIAPDGTVESGIDTGTFTGTRVKVLPL